MATSRWRSSLANVETRLRRTLGLAGPIDLELSTPPIATPVIILDDATRPGASSQLRGRRWMLEVPVGIGGGGNGSAWCFADPPTGFQNTSPLYEGGIIVDWIDVATGVPTVPATQVSFIVCYFPKDLTASPGLPVATVRNVSFIDPQFSASELAPIQSASAPLVAANANGGKIVYRMTNPGNGQPWRIPMNAFVNWNAAISVGNDAAAAANLNLNVVFHGRIF